LEGILKLDEGITRRQAMAGIGTPVPRMSLLGLCAPASRFAPPEVQP
jgi:hypothetical protein